MEDDFLQSFVLRAEIAEFLQRQLSQLVAGQVEDFDFFLLENLEQLLHPHVRETIAVQLEEIDLSLFGKGVLDLEDVHISQLHVTQAEASEVVVLGALQPLLRFITHFLVFMKRVHFVWVFHHCLPHGVIFGSFHSEGVLVVSQAFTGILIQLQGVSLRALQKRAPLGDGRVEFVLVDGHEVHLRGVPVHFLLFRHFLFLRYYILDHFGGKEVDLHAFSPRRARARVVDEGRLLPNRDARDVVDDFPHVSVVRVVYFILVFAGEFGKVEVHLFGLDLGSLDELPDLSLYFLDFVLVQKEELFGRVVQRLASLVLEEGNELLFVLVLGGNVVLVDEGNHLLDPVRDHEALVAVVFHYSLHSLHEEVLLFPDFAIYFREDFLLLSGQCYDCV